ncbi:baseplate J/gp47 family protein [Sporosarcina sp. FSL K6-1508]|uniref:baseplate J/gp47 family protein n=1 Tax=Sporosarcina sp. FSL K6-1508 TaxID=2921553 RepID=UPI0030FA0616
MVETEQQIHERMMYNTDDEQDKSTGNFIWDANMAIAIEASILQEEIEYVESLIDIENLEGDELSRFVYTRTGISRKLATKSVTTVIISGAEGSVISKGMLVGTDSLNFTVLDDAVMPTSGSVTVSVQAESFGVIGNVPTNSINRFPVSISGLVDVYNPNPVTNGFEAETDEDLTQRYFDKLQRPGKAGNKFHYEQWAKEVVGVGGVRVLPRWAGPLTVKVVIIDSNQQVADDELRLKVFDHIETERPFGADVTVVSATGVPVNISVALTLLPDYLEPIVIATIKKNVSDYLNLLAFKTTFVSYARIGAEIIASEGVQDYQNLLVNLGTANIPIGNEEVAIMGGINE